MQQLLCTDLWVPDKVEFSLVRAGAVAGVCLQGLSKNHPLPASYPVKPDYGYRRALLTALTKQGTFFFFLAFS